MGMAGWECASHGPGKKMVDVGSAVFTIIPSLYNIRTLLTIPLANASLLGCPTCRCIPQEYLEQHCLHIFSSTWTSDPRSRSQDPKDFKIR
jgi:hypothetical protein